MNSQTWLLIVLAAMSGCLAPARADLPGQVRLQVHVVYRAKFIPPPDLTGLMDDSLEIDCDGYAAWNWNLPTNGPPATLNKLNEEVSLLGGGAGFLLTSDPLVWTYQVEKQTNDNFLRLVFDRENGRAVMDLNDILDQQTLAVTPFWETPMALNLIRLADNLFRANVNLRTIRFDPNLENHTRTGHISIVTPEDYLPSSASIEIDYTFSYSDYPLEAVMLPPQNYAQWLPAAQTTEDAPGTNLTLKVELRVAGQPGIPPPHKAKFGFRLLNVSAEPGVCLNAPDPAKAQRNADLRFQPSPLLLLREDGLYAETSNFVTSSSITLNCFDWGAYGQLEVTAMTDNQRELTAYVDGDPLRKTLTVPLDNNGNRIADVWENQHGILASNLPPDWDEAWLPGNQKRPGDGISLYEKYRGFVFFGDHERLAPEKKVIFLYDPDGIAGLLMTDPRSKNINLGLASGCQVRFIDEGAWTGPGAAGGQKRVVNFNTSGFGHATDQHAINIQANLEEEPASPAAWQDLMSSAGLYAGDGPAHSTLGLAFQDPTAAMLGRSPKSTYLCVIYLNQIREFIRETVFYHTRGLPPYTNYANLTPAEKTAMANQIRAVADQYIRDNQGAYWTRSLQQAASVLTHEEGHALGIFDHSPAHEGNRQCLMRLFDWELPRNPGDRFELLARNPWPNLFCTNTTATLGKGCQAQIQVTDRE